MPQYQTGTVDVTSGSNVVTGHGTSWLKNISTGDSFMVNGINVHYQVASVDSDTQITLTANWVGATATYQNYNIVRDFTQNYGFPEIGFGDRQWPFRLSQALRAIDSRLAILAARVETKATTTTSSSTTTTTTA